MLLVKCLILQFEWLLAKHSRFSLIPGEGTSGGKATCRLFLPPFYASYSVDVEIDLGLTMF